MVQCLLLWVGWRMRCQNCFHVLCVKCGYHSILPQSDITKPCCWSIKLVFWCSCPVTSDKHRLFYNLSTFGDHSYKSMSIASAQMLSRTPLVDGKGLCAWNGEVCGLRCNAIEHLCMDFLSFVSCESVKPIPSCRNAWTILSSVPNPYFLANGKVWSVQTECSESRRTRHWNFVLKWDLDQREAIDGLGSFQKEWWSQQLLYQLLWCRETLQDMGAYYGYFHLYYGTKLLIDNKEMHYTQSLALRSIVYDRHRHVWDCRHDREPPSPYQRLTSSLNSQMPIRKIHHIHWPFTLAPQNPITYEILIAFLCQYFPLANLYGNYSKQKH